MVFEFDWLFFDFLTIVKTSIIIWKKTSDDLHTCKKEKKTVKVKNASHSLNIDLQPKIIQICNDWLTMSL